MPHIADQQDMRRTNEHSSTKTPFIVIITHSPHTTGISHTLYSEIEYQIDHVKSAATYAHAFLCEHRLFGEAMQKFKTHHIYSRSTHVRHSFFTCSAGIASCIYATHTVLLLVVWFAFQVMAQAV